MTKRMDNKLTYFEIIQTLLVLYFVSREGYDINVVFVNLMNFSCKDDMKYFLNAAIFSQFKMYNSLITFYA